MASTNVIEFTQRKARHISDLMVLPKVLHEEKLEKDDVEAYLSLDANVRHTVSLALLAHLKRYGKTATLALARETVRQLEKL